MKQTLLVPFAAALLLATLAAVASPVEPPAGFGVRSTCSLRQVHYSEGAGHVPNHIDRAAIEEFCKFAMEQGVAQRMPEFGPGYDEPARTRSVQFRTPDATQTATFTEATLYGCDDPAKLKHGNECACNYRRNVEHQIEITHWKAGRLNRWSATLETAKGTHAIIPRPSPLKDPPHPDALETVFGPVIGNGSAAGFKCELRQLTAGPAIRQACFALPDPRLPKIMWGEPLSTDSHVPTTPRMRLGYELQRLEVDVEVDSGVFDPPTGIAYRERSGPALKEASP